jgi:MarR family transcriptional regulator, organic hydroperoxide resistance regulator
VNRPQLLLSNQLCFLFYRAEKAIMAKYRPLLSEIGLTYPQYLTMLAIWERRAATVGELSQALTLDTGTVSPLLKRLEALGFVSRNKSKDDGRSVTVSLTRAGAELEAAAAKIPGKLVTCIGLPLAELAALEKTLRRALPALEA